MSHLSYSLYRVNLFYFVFFFMVGLIVFPLCIYLFKFTAPKYLAGSLKRAIWESVDSNKNGGRGTSAVRRSRLFPYRARTTGPCPRYLWHKGEWSGFIQVVMYFSLFKLRVFRKCRWNRVSSKSRTATGTCYSWERKFTCKYDVRHVGSVWRHRLYDEYFRTFLQA